MQFLLDNLLGVIRPIGPHRWASLIRRLRRGQGWFPPMMLIATMGVLVFIRQGFGLLGGNIALEVFNYVALATWFVVGLLSSLAVTIDGLNNLKRFGISGMSRPRWWFELSRLTWMLLLFAALSTPFIHFVGGPLLRPLGGFLFGSLRPSSSLFWFSALALISCLA